MNAVLEGLQHLELKAIHSPAKCMEAQMTAASTATAAATRLALARRYRPRTLSELIGQPALQRTLANAVQSGRQAHAYMFSGPRGTGKTSTARILARALNCEQGPTPEPCGTCAQCQAILADRHLDVIEMDAASRTGVDDVRQLIEGIPYAPVQGRFKIYIVDEAHMLSKNAWNALLKTLEEPPAHSVFVFCTTEPRKVPATVLSRCQRFQLQHIAAAELSTLFTTIAAAEGVKVSPEAIQIVVRAAEGSARDGLSILDQLIAAYPTGASGAEARDLLGLPDQVRIRAILKAALERNPQAALTAWRELLQGGADPAQGIKDLMQLVHDLAIIQAAPGAAPVCGIRTSTNGKTNIPYERLQAAWAILSKAAQEMNDAPDRHAAGDMAILRLSA